MKKTIWSAINLVLVAAFALAACSPAATATPTSVPQPTAAVAATTAPQPTAAPTGPSGEVTLWHAYQTGGSEEAALATLIANAQAAYPDLTINVLQIPFGDIEGKYLNEVAAGGGPDMFLMPNDNLGNWARSGSILELDSYLEGKLGNVSTVAIDGMKVDGKLYGVPESAKAVALYYNKDLVTTPPATTEELMAMVQDGTRLVQNQNGYHLFGWFPAFGGQLLDGTNTCIADQGGFTEAMQYLVELKAAGAEFFTDGGAATSEFRNGAVGLYINGPWELADNQKALGDKLGVAPIPTGPGGPSGPLNGIDGFYVNPNSQNIEGAVELALFLTGQESSQIYTDEAGHVPIRSDVTATDELLKGFALASSTGFPRPQSAEFGNYWGPFGDMITKVLEGESAPGQGVFEACQAMNDANSKVVASAAPVSGEITLWHAYQTGGSEEAALATLIAATEAKFPELTINVLQIPFGDIEGKYLNEVAAGGGPDMYVMPNDNLGNWARSGSILELDSYLAGRLGSVSGPGVEGMKVDGKLYGVPESAKAVALYYNKDLVPTPPATTEELLALVQGGTRLVQNQNAYHLFGWFPAFGGQLFDADNKCVADQGGFAEAMQYLVDLKAAGAEFFTDGGAATSEFRAGAVGLYINGPWELADNVLALGDKLGVAPIPTGPNGPSGPLNGIDGFYINPNSANIASAVEVALYLTGQESSQLYTDEAGHVPIRSDVASADELLAGFALASSTGFPRPQSAEFGNYWGPFGDMITKVLEGELTPVDGVAEACAAVNTANGK